MKTILIGIFAFILLFGFILLGWYYYLRWRFRQTITAKYYFIAPLIAKLARGDTISKEEVEMMVQNGSVTHAAYRALKAYGRLDLFPSDFLTIEKGAESFLITWLEYPTEVGEAPNEIQLFTTIALDGILNLTYYVFKYKMRTDHWAGGYNWMFGVVGPYHPHSKPYDIPAKIFSRFNSTDTTTAEEEARWVHENVLQFSRAHI